MYKFDKIERVETLKEKMLKEKRKASIEQAKIITRVYKENEDKSIVIKRALSLSASLKEIEISIEPEELIVGNRTKGVRGGVIFPEGGMNWVLDEIETLPTRKQDKFEIDEEDIKTFREEIYPYWVGKSLEDTVDERFGKEINSIKKVAKINQTDHAQGHIIPNCQTWLEKGPQGLLEIAKGKYELEEDKDKKEFYKAIEIVMNGASKFMIRYSELLDRRKEEDEKYTKSMEEVSRISKKLSTEAPETFHEAVQSIWYLFVILQMESNASSFSPGRMDQYLYPYYKRDLDKGIITKDSALEILECMWLKFNEIVYLRSSGSAKYFAGFPIGFNIAISGSDENGNDNTNDLSYLMLACQEHIRLPQPNLSVRLHENTPETFLRKSVEVVSKGGGMPQYFNDKAIIPTLLKDINIEKHDAYNYGIVGCVELTTQGNNLGWSDAAMFNLNKALELAITGGIDLLNKEEYSPNFGKLEDCESYEELEEIFEKVIDYYIDKMIRACEVVEKVHIDIMPTAYLSSVIDGCIEKGLDVTAGGAKYNLSGIQMIQVANLADSLAAIKKLVFDEKRISKEELVEALYDNFEGHEYTRALLLNKSPKYGNDVEWVDEIGRKWAIKFADKLKKYTNYRGGVYHTGMYTVSAHVPMGENVGASPDGRKAYEALADGGMSPVYGRDVEGPTAVLKSVSRLDNYLTTNGGLLNMKFLPSFFEKEYGIEKFAQFLRTFVDLEIPHIQFNVVNREELIAAREEPEKYPTLTIRVAGYTAYFTELADKLQEEIIDRTAYGAM